MYSGFNLGAILQSGHLTSMVLHTWCFAPYDLAFLFSFLPIFSVAPQIVHNHSLRILWPCVFYFQKVKRQIQAQTEIRDDGKHVNLLDTIRGMVTAILLYKAPSEI